jgi:hypothetical protein
MSRWVKGGLVSVGLAALTLLVGCGAWHSLWSDPGAPATSQRGHHGARRAQVETVTVRVPVKDPESEQRVARLELRLLEDEARVQDLQTRLDDARQEVVRAMAKLQTLASRAEAASGMAEAEIALDSLKAAAGPQPPAEVGQAAQLLQMSSAEFDKQNYGGALYLANQAKNLTAVGKGLVASTDQGALRSGEVVFALPLRVSTTALGNLREGPGTSFKVLHTLDPGTPLIAYSYVDLWVRVRDETGERVGWILYSLLGRRQDPK